MERHNRAVGGAWRNGRGYEATPPSLRRRWRGAKMAAEPGPGPDPELEELLESERGSGAFPLGVLWDGMRGVGVPQPHEVLWDGRSTGGGSPAVPQGLWDGRRRKVGVPRPPPTPSHPAGGDAASQQEFTSCLKETLSGLARNATDLQGSAASEEELAKAMEGLGLEEGGGEGGVLPVVQSVLQHLLSRDVLYPSLKEITDKYPEWLQRHRAALPEEQYERYRAQHGVMGRICQQLEAERPEDSDGARRARFEAVLELMQQLQELGHPPKELAAGIPPWGWAGTHCGAENPRCVVSGT
uniref:Peroxisomal biogenesis factor 19 n=1 Tax=Pavo cristatus TaxID=9049 RepID=A0A8C9FCQ4_PAVCR